VGGGGAHLEEVAPATAAVMASAWGSSISGDRVRVGEGRSHGQRTRDLNLNELAAAKAGSMTSTPGGETGEAWGEEYVARGAPRSAP
jgi:hypothetical protein